MMERKRLSVLTAVFLMGVITVLGQGKPQCPAIRVDDPSPRYGNVGDSIFGIADSKNVWRLVALP